MADAPTITFRDAAGAAGVSEKVLRNWLDRKLIHPSDDEDRAKGGWRRFSAHDVVRLALISRLAAYGFTLSEAAEVLAMSVGDGRRALGTYGDVPAPELANAMVHLKIALTQQSGERFRVLRWQDAETPPELEKRPDYVVLNLGEIAAAVLRRLNLGARP